MQRENDRRSAESKLDLDEKLADLQRNQSEKQRAHELEIEANRYDQETEKHRHGLLTIYMNEVEALIIKYNGTITSDARLFSIMHGKTLTLIRQLDTTLKAHLIRFFVRNRTVDYWSATSGFDRCRPWWNRFEQYYIYDSTNAQFSKSITSQADFSATSLGNASFTNAILINASFANSNGNGTKFDRVSAIDSNFFKAALPSSSFVRSSLGRANFLRANLSAANFSMSDLNATVFMYALMERANLNMVKGNNALFSYANLIKATLQRAELDLGNFF
jgi:hypothetical protein